MKTKLASLFLAILLLISCIGCAIKEQTDASPNADTQNIESEEETTVFVYQADYLPDRDFEGYVFRVVTVDWLPTDVAEETGDVVNDSYYKRNRLIEQKYNIDFSQTDVPTYMAQTDTFRRSTLAASDDFDLCRLIMRDAFSFALDGYAALPEQLPYIDMSQDWYIKWVNEALTIKGKPLLAYSDECIDAFTGMMCVFFNKNIAEDLGLTSPYELVDNGLWTIDTFWSYAKTAIYDVDNDGKYTFGVDRFGLLGEYDMSLPCMWIGAGLRTIEKDEDDIPYFAGYENENIYSLMTKVCEYWNTEGMAYDSFLGLGFDEANRFKGYTAYSNGEGLFIVNGFGAASNFRDMDDDFGIIPMPKGSEEQKSYHTRLADGWLNIAPYCAPDLERTSIILEALAIETKNYVIPAIYEVAIKNKYIRDQESLEMLDLIQKNRIIDLGDTVWYETVRNLFVAPVVENNPSFASRVKSSQKIVEKTIEKALQKVDEMQQ